jgi:hypothetical protein
MLTDEQIIELAEKEFREGVFHNGPSRYVAFARAILASAGQAGPITDETILEDAAEAFGRSREYSNCFGEPSERSLLHFVRKYMRAVPTPAAAQEAIADKPEDAAVYQNIADGYARDLPAPSQDVREAFEAWKQDPRYYQWNTNDQHAELNFTAGYLARASASPAPSEIDKRDAERYRWIRSAVLPFKACASGNPNWTFSDYGPGGASFDEAIDAELERIDRAEGKT